MKSGMVLTVTLSPAVDKTVYLSRLVPGREHEAGKTICSAGGKGINVARTLLRLGVPVMATGFLGGISGAWITESLKREGIPQNFFRVPGATRTCLTVIHGPGKRLTRLLEPGPRLRRKDLDSFLKRYQQMLSRSRAVVLAGRSAPGCGDRFYATLVHRAIRAGVFVVLDTSGPPLKFALKAGPSLVKPNLPEAESLLGMRLRNATRLKEGLRRLKSLGAGCAVISQGARGAVALDETDRFWKAVPPVLCPENSVGSGDALAAGWIAAQMAGEPAERKLKQAVAVGSAGCLKPVPGDLSRRDLARLSPRVRVRAF